MPSIRNQRVLIPVTIASSGNLSGEVNVGGGEIVGILMPAAWDTAGITFAALVADGTTFGKVQNEAGTEVAVTSPAAGLYIAFSSAQIAATRGLGRIKVRSGTAATPVTQTATRNFFLAIIL